MQDCFRQHPEIYGSELEDDEDEVEQELLARENDPSNQHEEPSSAAEATPPVAQKTAKPSEPKTAEAKTAEPKTAPEDASSVAEKTSKGTPDASIETSNDEQDDKDKDDELIQKAAHDATR
jgi:intermembrane space import and assembly protein 40